MKRKLFFPFLIISFLITGCLGRHKIIIESGKDSIVSCPKYAKAGQVIEIETVIVDDADLYLILDGERLEPVREGVYNFEMPDHDVTIKVVIIANGLA